MKAIRRISLSVLITLCFAALAAGQSYTVTVIPSPAVGASAVNDRGYVVGFGNFSAGSQHAFVWSAAGGLHDLGVLAGGTYSYAYGINNSGEVVGYSSGTNSGGAFLWTTKGGMQSLGTGATAYAINNSGQVVGTAPFGNAGHAFLWTSATGMEDLGTLGGSYSVAYAVNDAGEVVGLSTLADNITNHGFVWTQAGGMHDLGLSGEYVLAYGINDSGTIVGLYERTATSAQYAFVRPSNGKIFQTGALAGDSTVALSAGPENQVVGYSGSPTGEGEHAFLWTQANGIQDLNDLVPPGYGVLAVANAINKSGQIAASVAYPDFGVELLTPVQK